MWLLIGLSIVPPLLCLLAQKRFEQVLAPFACGAILLCYALACFQRLQWFVFFVYAAAALCAVLLIARRKTLTLRRSLGLIFTPGLVCFALLAVFLYYAALPHVVSATDDIHYWAVEPYSLFAVGGLTDAAHHLAPRFMTYTPGMPLFQWIGLAVAGEWSESMLYFMLFLLYLIFLLPFSERITWRKAYWMPVFCAFAVGVPTLMNPYSYSMLRVDTALGLCLGYALVQANRPSRGGTVNLCLSLCVLALLKQVGIAWALLPLSLACVRARQAHLKPLRPLVAALCPIAVFASWKLFCAAQGLTGVHLNEASAQISAMLNGSWVAPENLSRLPETLWKCIALPVGGLSDPTVVAEQPLLEVPRIWWLLLFVGLPLGAALIGRKPAHRALALWAALCIVGFFIAYTLLSMTSFYHEIPVGDDWVVMHYLMGRYFCPLLFGMFLLFCYEIISSHARPIRLGGLALLALICVFCFNWQHVAVTLDPTRFAEDTPEDIYYYASDNFWTDELDEPTSAIVLYGTVAYTDYPERLQYALAPVKLVQIYGELDDPGFVRLLKRSKVTHVVVTDDENQVYDCAVHYAEDGWIEPFSPYAVEWDGDVPVLVY